MLKWQTPKGAALRHCAKVAVAAVAAYLFTQGGHNEYALFSVLGAALVVGGSVGENLNLSLYRVRGTLAGTLVGILLAYAFGMSVWSLGLSVAILAWLCTGLGWGGAAMRVGIAMALVVIFTHSSDAAHYAGWRMLNTLIGVTVGIAVGFLVWPVRGRDEIASAIEQCRGATAALLGALVDGASGNALTPFQRRLLDALTAVRAARKNALLERQVDPNAELLTARTLHTGRLGIAALGASIKLDELVSAGIAPQCLAALRDAVGSLARQVQDAAEAAADDFPARHDSASRESENAGLDPEARALLAGTLAELQQIRAALDRVRTGSSP